MQKQFTLRVDGGQHRELSIVAAATGKTMTDLMLRAIAMVIEEESEKDPRIAAMLRELRVE